MHTNSHIKYSRVIHQLGDRLAIVNGAGEWFEPTSYQMGVKAFISGFANFAPALCRDSRRSMAGDYVGQRRQLTAFGRCLRSVPVMAQFGPTQGRGLQRNGQDTGVLGLVSRVYPSCLSLSGITERLRVRWRQGISEITPLNEPRLSHSWGGLCNLNRRSEGIIA